MAILVTTDPHFTDNPNHEYRWKLFDTLIEICRSRPNGVKIHQIVICGDLTEAKSGHSARLVNRMVVEFQRLTEWVTPVHIVPGNHDHEPGEQSFFEFLGYMPGILFHTDVGYSSGSPSAVFVPNGKLPIAMKMIEQHGKQDLAFLHEGFRGVQLANGTKLEGGEEMPSRLKDLAYKIYSGDIHTPQKFGPVTYIGTPYPIDFDEQHACRVFVIDIDGKACELPVNIVKKHTLRVRSMENLESLLQDEVQSGDQVKVVWHLDADDFAETACIHREIVSRVQGAQAFLTGGVRFEVNAKDGGKIASIDCKDLSAVNTAQAFFGQYVKLRGVEPRLATLGKKIVRGRAVKGRKRK